MFLDLFKAILSTEGLADSDDTVRADEESDETDMSAKNKEGDGIDMYGEMIRI